MYYKYISVLLSVLCLISCQQVPSAPEQPSHLTESVLSLGVILTAAPPDNLTITDIYWNSPADTAGIKVNDQLVEVAGKEVHSLPAVLSRLETLHTGDSVTVKVIREEGKISVTSGAKNTEVSTDDLPAKYEELLNKTKIGETLAITATRTLVPLEFSLKITPPPSPVRIVNPDGRPSGRPAGTTGTQSPWMGVQLADINNLEEVGGSAKAGQKAVKIEKVLPNTPAERAGLRNGDVIVAYDGKTFPAEAPSAMGVLTPYIKEHQPGQVIRVSILRPDNIIDTLRDGQPGKIEPDKIVERIKDLPTPAELNIKITKVTKAMDIHITLAPRPEAKATQPVEEWTNDTFHPELINYTTPIEIGVKKIISMTNITDKYDDLMKRFAEDEKWDDGFRLKEFRYLHRDPWKMEKVATDLVDRLRAAVRKEDFPELIQVVGEKLDALEKIHKLPPEDVIVLKTGITLEEHIAQIERVLETSVKLRNEAFAGLTKNDMQFLSDNIYSFTDLFIRDFNLESPEVSKIDKRLLDLPRYINYRKLFESAQVLAGLLDPDYLKGLYNDLSPLGDKEIVFSKDTKWGKIIIGGKGKNTYTEPAAVIIDLGGDDFYANNVGSTSLDHPVSLIIDYSGNDTYSSYNNGCQGAGIFGVSILADLGGDDEYICQDWGQGVGLFGIGLLYDKEGNDIYRGQEYVQGAGFFGAGMLIDNSGNDRYIANLYAQGFGLTKGCGLLLDAQGNDEYYATGKYPNGYPENVGTFGGFSQGCGTGIRAYSDGELSRSGGIGILIDGQGSDHYEAGTFSQGGGYFFGWGILYDGGNENDTYLGTRYAQGFAAHSALGFFLDEGGDDYYGSHTKPGVHCGLAWDLSATVFIDKGGNDTYDVEGGFSLGAAAHNGFTIFYDAGGKDTYNCELDKNKGSNSYHGGTSLSIFLDEDAADDKHEEKGLTPDIIEVSKEYALVINLKEKINDLTDEVLKHCLKDLTK